MSFQYIVLKFTYDVYMLKNICNSHDKSERLSQERVESLPNVSHMNNLPEKSLRFHTNLIPNAL